MKKVFILFLLLITSFCTIIPSVSGFVDPTILDPIDGMLFGETSGISYMFFSEEQTVLIYNAKGGVNSYYKLLNGEAHNNDVLSYKLDGWGSYGGNYIGIYMRGTDLGISIQSSRSSAINATKHLGSSTSLSTGITQARIDPALYVLSVLSPVVQTSAAGIFKPDKNNFLSITDLVPGANFPAKLVESIQKEDGTHTSTPYNLQIVDLKGNNLSGVSTIYQYIDGTSSVLLIGIKFDFNNKFPRLQIIKRKGTDLDSSIASLTQELNSVSTWEYSFFSTLRVLDDSLTPYLDKTFIEFITQLANNYNPLTTTRLFFNKKEDSLRVTRTYNNVFTEEDYLIVPTSTSGVSELIDFRNDGTQTFSGKFLTITSDNAIDTEGTISTVTIANTENGFNNPIFKTALKQIKDVTPTGIQFRNLDIRPTIALGAAGIDGRSGFQAYVNSVTDNIHLIGGYTTPGYFPSGIPRTENTLTAELQTLYNPEYLIKNIGTSPSSTASGLNLDRTILDGNLGFQQMIGAVTKKSQTRSQDTFWAYGTGAVPKNLRKFSYHDNTTPLWRTTQINADVSLQKYHQAMVAHNTNIYIMGGTSSTAEIGNLVDDPTETYGIFNNTIYMAPVDNPDAWSLPRTPSDLTPIWAPRVHARVFSIGKTLVLVGGMTGGTGSTAPTPVNDVWISENNGTNWSLVNDGVTDPTVVDAVLPPKQNSIDDGALIGTAHNGIIYLLNNNRELFYSSNKGKDWYKSGNDFTITPPTPLYGAQLVGFKNELILIGGQTDVKGVGIMEDKIYKLKLL